MLNLFRTDLYKLIHLKSFYGIVLLVAFFDFVILADLSQYPDSYQSTYDNFLQLAMYTFSVWQFMPLVIPLALGILICLFVTNDFTYGTMKDPVTLGHSRFHVFLSKCVVTSVIAIIIILACVIVSLFVGITMFHGLNHAPAMEDIVQVGIQTLLEMSLTVALAILFTTIAFIVRNTAFVMAIHFSVALFVTMIISAIFIPSSPAFYAWLGTAMATVAGPFQLETVWATFVVVAAYVLVAFMIGYGVFAKRDMK